MPRRKAESAKKAAGTLRKCRTRGSVVELPSSERLPEAPDWLPEDATEEWSRLVPILKDAGLLSDGDLSMLAVLCECWGSYARKVRCGTEIRTSERTELRRLYQCFGLTPEARKTGAVVAAQLSPEVKKWLEHSEPMPRWPE